MESLGGFVVQFWLTNLGLEGFEVWFIRIWALVWPISGQTGLKFELFGGVRMGLQFGFGRQTCVQVENIHR